MLKSVLCLLILGITQALAAKQPNIVWIFADDLGFNDIGYKNDMIHTPNLDSLAKKGVIFKNMYVQPACSPSRHAFMTGRYPFASRMQHNVIFPVSPECSPLEYKFLPQHLKDLGYDTHMVGKWHLGYCKKECTPINRGFDTFYGLYDGEGDYYTHTSSGLYDWHDQDKVDYSANNTHSEILMVKRVEEILDKKTGDKPFFLYFPIQNPHSPLQPQPQHLKHYEDLDLTDKRKKYLGLVTGMDDMVKKVVDKLEATGLMDNTYLFFLADNGGDIHEADNSPLRGAKATLWEAGTKSNSFMYSPLLKRTGYEHGGLIHVTDWLPTLVKMAGGEIPAVAGIDGIDQTAMIKDGKRSKRRNMVYNIDREYWQGDVRCGEIGIRDKRFKLIWGMPGGNDGYGLEGAAPIYDLPYYIKYVDNLKSKEKRGGGHLWNEEQTKFMNAFMNDVKVTDEKLAAGTGYMHLFDLKEDPTESNNLVDSERADVVKAKKKLIKFARREIYKKYKSYIPGTKDMLFGLMRNGYFESGWCKDLMPSEE